MNFRPLYDRVLIKRVEAEARTSSGLYIPDSAKEKPLEAIVVAVGDGRIGKDGELKPMTVKIGDQVLFGKYTGDEVKLDGVDHIILKEEDILAIVVREEAAAAAAS